MEKRLFRYFGITALFVVLAMFVGVDARQTTGGNARPAVARAQQIDQEYTKRILDATPDKRILTELVDHMPASSTVPSPLKFFGYVPGENSTVTYHKDIVRYYEALATRSRRLA